MEAIQKAMPELSRSTIPSKTYKSLEKDYESLGVYNFAIVRADLPDDLVYQLLKVVFENTHALAQEVPSASDTLPKNVDKNTFLPFHSGAVRYYHEIGINIPAALMPTN
jgi:TRAP transporter TAXI family solute receptor